MRLPQPVHGWRGFAGEVGIIVLGVLIALAANSVYDDWHWRQTLAEERQALNDEVATNYRAQIARRVQQHCIDRRLGDLARVFARQAAGQPLGLFAPIGRPVVWFGASGALQMATADGSLSHMPLADKQAYFATADDYRQFASAVLDERTAWRALERLDDRASLDAQDWRELRKAYRDALDTNRVLKTNLVFHDSNAWLKAYERFGRMPLKSSDVMTAPWARDLCRPAVTA